MNNITLTVFLLALLSTACSSKKASNQESQAPVEEVSDALLYDDLGDSISLSGDDELLLFDEEATADASPAVSEPMDNLLLEEPKEEYAQNQGAYQGVESYTVQKNDTLMLISWKIYGDYAKWRDLAAKNQGILNGGQKVIPGMVLSYDAPATAFNWRPNGNPYLIVRGDTLGIISNKVYGSESKWKSIWDNNRPLIKDPNLIFAGFTLYYLTGGDVAYQN